MKELYKTDLLAKIVGGTVIVALSNSQATSVEARELVKVLNQTMLEQKHLYSGACMFKNDNRLYYSKAGRTIVNTSRKTLDTLSYMSGVQTYPLEMLMNELYLGEEAKNYKLQWSGVTGRYFIDYKLNVVQVELSKELLNYTFSEGYALEFKTVADLKAFYKRYEDNEVVRKKDIFQYNVDDIITLGSIEFRIKSNHRGWFLEAQEHPNGKVFSSLGIEDKGAFIKDVLGYTSDVGHFPYIKTLSDLNTLIHEFRKIAADLNKEMMADLNTEIMEYRAGSKVIFLDWMHYTVHKSTSEQYFLTRSGGTNSEIFSILGIKPKLKFCKEIADGDVYEGDFPVMNLADLNKVIKAIRKLPVYLKLSSEGKSPLTGEPLITPSSSAPPFVEPAPPVVEPDPEPEPDIDFYSYNEGDYVSFMGENDYWIRATSEGTFYLERDYGETEDSAGDIFSYLGIMNPSHYCNTLFGRVVITMSEMNQYVMSLKELNKFIVTIRAHPNYYGFDTKPTEPTEVEEGELAPETVSTDFIVLETDADDIYIPLSVRK